MKKVRESFRDSPIRWIITGLFIIPMCWALRRVASPTEILISLLIAIPSVVLFTVYCADPMLARADKAVEYVFVKIFKLKPSD